MRQTVRQADSRIAIHDLKTQAVHIDQEISTEITLARLCMVFAGLALVIACVGLYGTVAFNVARRTNEIGVRMTLGARRGHIVWMVLREIVVMTAIGLAIGIPLALAGSALRPIAAVRSPAARSGRDGHRGWRVDAVRFGRRADSGAARRRDRSDGGDSARIANP